MTDMADVRAAFDPRRIQSGQEFADALTGLRHRAGRSIRQVARITAIPSATLGGYFSGRHLPPATQPHLLDEILAALGERDPDLVAQWHAALLRVRRGPARGVRQWARTSPTEWHQPEPGARTVRRPRRGHLLPSRGHRRGVGLDRARASRGPGSRPADPAGRAAEDTDLYSVHVQSGGASVLAGGSAGTLVAWQTDAAAAAQSICATTGTPITEVEWQRVAPGAPFTQPCPARADA